MIDLRPATLREANEIVARWHSHHRQVRGHLFSIAAEDGREIVGVVIVGRPVAPALCDGRTLEVTRLCTNRHRNAASKLLGGGLESSARDGGS